MSDTQPTPSTGHGRLSHALEGYSTSAHTDNYDKMRTDYTDESIHMILNHALIPYVDQHPSQRELTVIDVGSGTGKFLRPLDRILHHDIQPRHPLFIQHHLTVNVKAIEPVEGMRRKAKERSPHLDILDGHGESMPLDDASVALAICSQSFHWFATDRSVREFHRVLADDGYMCLVWNTRNTAVGWVRELDDIIDTYYTPDVPRQQNNSWKRCLIDADEKYHLFTPLQHIEMIDHVVTRSSVDDVVKYVQSISVIAKLPDEEKAIAGDKIRQLLATHPDLRGKPIIELPFRTDIYYTQKRRQP